jgi:hypothetical protein
MSQKVPGLVKVAAWQKLLPFLPYALGAGAYMGRNQIGQGLGYMGDQYGKFKDWANPKAEATGSFLKGNAGKIGGGLLGTALMMATRGKAGPLLRHSLPVLGAGGGALYDSNRKKKDNWDSFVNKRIKSYRDNQSFMGRNRSREWDLLEDGPPEGLPYDPYNSREGIGYRQGMWL